eukprot:COSAG05_NODE_3800_length_1831_cov_32.714203_1_plen_83_part_10
MDALALLHIAGVGGRQAESRLRTRKRTVILAASVVHFSAVAVWRFVTPVRWLWHLALLCACARLRGVVPSATVGDCFALAVRW